MLLLELFSPQGRSGRQAFATALCLSFGLSVGMMVLLERLQHGLLDGPAMLLPIGLLFGLPCLAAVRRLHDFGESGENLIQLLIPIVNLYAAGRLLLKAGEHQNNAYGPDPRAGRMSPKWRLALGILMLLSLGLPWLSLP